MYISFIFCLSCLSLSLWSSLSCIRYKRRRKKVEREKKKPKFVCWECPALSLTLKCRKENRKLILGDRERRWRPGTSIKSAPAVQHRSGLDERKRKTNFLSFFIIFLARLSIDWRLAALCYLRRARSESAIQSGLATRQGVEIVQKGSACSRGSGRLICGAPWFSERERERKRWRWWKPYRALCADTGRPITALYTHTHT